MGRVISKVTQLDKEMREKVAALEEELSKLPVFLREQKKMILEQYETKSKERVQSRKLEIKTALDKTQHKAEKELQKSIANLTERYKHKKDEWINEIYKQIIDDFQGE